jgi:hypothetical protein
VDILDFFSGELPWRKFFNLVERLPSWGAYKGDLAMDEEWARRVVDWEDQQEIETGMAYIPEDHDPTPHGYTTVDARLDLIADRIMAVRTAVQASGGGDEPTFEPIQRPVTAIERERERRARSVLLDVDAMILGAGVGTNGIMLMDG